MDKICHSVVEVMGMLGISRGQMYDILNTGELKSFKIGRRRMIRREDVDAFISKAMDQAHPPKDYDSNGTMLRVVK